MSDCYDHKCVECDRTLPVHIADWCTDRMNVLARCESHRPAPENGWVKFTNIHHNNKAHGTWFMTVVDRTHLPWDCDVGHEGGIHPNTVGFDESHL